MPKSIQAALVPLLVAVLSAWATKLGIDAHSQLDSIYTIAAAMAAVLVAAYGWVMNHRDKQKVQRAETIVPGITTIPKGSEVQAKVVVNDPTTPDPPTEIVNETKSSP